MKKKHSVRKVILILLAAIIIIAPVYIVATDYIKGLPVMKYTYGNVKKAAYPDMKFAVISDLHYYDTSLGTTGKAYETCFKSDRKLIADSSYILNFAVDKIIKSGVKLVLVSGDLTKDGELLCHQKVVEELSKLADNGIKVCVVPGNHDVNNPGAFKYDGDKSIPVPNISAVQFTELYKNMGYKDALYHDKDTLSYVAEPVEGLWVVALDTTRSRENRPGHEEIVGGKLLQSQIDWLESMLSKANLENKAVIVLQHHGVVEHWDGQSKLHPDYLVPEYKYVGRMLSSYGVRIVFTGHYHSQDVTSSDFKDDGFIYDLETGSLITPSCPIRYCTIASNKLTVSEDTLIDELHPGTDFEEKGNKLVHDNVSNEAYNTLKKYKVPGNDALSIANQVGFAFAAHIKGDENQAERPGFDAGKLSLWGRIVDAMQKYAIDGLWKDLPPSDNNTTLELGK